MLRNLIAAGALCFVAAPSVAQIGPPAGPPPPTPTGQSVLEDDSGGISADPGKKKSPTPTGQSSVFAQRFADMGRALRIDEAIPDLAALLDDLSDGVGQAGMIAGSLAGQSEALQSGLGSPPPSAAAVSAALGSVASGLADVAQVTQVGTFDDSTPFSESASAYAALSAALSTAAPSLGDVAVPLGDIVTALTTAADAIDTTRGDARLATVLDVLVGLADRHHEVTAALLDLGSEGGAPGARPQIAVPCGPTQLIGIENYLVTVSPGAGITCGGWVLIFGIGGCGVWQRPCTRTEITCLFTDVCCYNSSWDRFIGASTACALTTTPISSVVVPFVETKVTCGVPPVAPPTVPPVIEKL